MPAVSRKGVSAQAVKLAAAGVAAACWLVPSGAAAADAGRVQISLSECAAFTRHIPAPGVQYEPNRDARGRPVVPADVGGGPAFTLPETISIDLGINLAEKYGLGGGGRYTGEGVVGTVTVTNGRAYLNGKPLDAAERNAIAEACRKQGAPR